MGIMTSSNTRNGKLAFLLIALACLVVGQLGFAEDQDFDQLRQAAEQGDAEAQNNLGGMYDNGDGVPKDDREAMKWFRRAAEQGFPPAQYNLGVMYNFGRGVPENDAEAVIWFRKAAEQGDAGAQSSLGSMYAVGEGVPEDYVKAYVWANLAAAQGDEDAVRLKVELRPKMSVEQVAEAQKLSDQLFKRLEASALDLPKHDRSSMYHRAEPIYRIGEGVTPPTLIYKREPAYSEAARNAKLQGTVLLSAIVRKDGSLESVKVLRGLGLGLDKKAIAALMTWRFRPGMKGGRPVDVAVNIEVNFRLL